MVIILLLNEVGSSRLEESDYTRYQSKDPNTTIPTYRQKEEKGKISRKQKESEQLGNKKALTRL